MNNKLWNEEQLYTTLKDSQIIRVERLRTGNASILISEFGGRVLGLFPSIDHPNTLFVHPDITGQMKNRDWCLGGERQWIAPQQDYFFTNPESFNDFLVQDSIDPGTYRKTDDFEYVNTFSIRNYITRQTIDNCISKRSFALIPKDPFDSGIAFAGVSIDDSLFIPGCKNHYSAWSIAMVATCGISRPGTIFFPSCNPSKVTPYFSPLPSSRFATHADYARFLIDSKDPFKCATEPDGTDWENPVKIVYCAPFDQSDIWYCVVKVSNDLPQSQDECVDIPAGGRDGKKGAIQGYNHGYGSTLLYGEIELQFTKGDAAHPSHGKHDLLSYCGSKNEIFELLKVLLRSNDVVMY